LLLALKRALLLALKFERAAVPALMCRPPLKPLFIWVRPALARLIPPPLACTAAAALAPPWRDAATEGAVIASALASAAIITSAGLRVRIVILHELGVSCDNCAQPRFVPDRLKFHA
jgi:hypothetical protein